VRLGRVCDVLVEGLQDYDLVIDDRDVADA
jgi:hypothetical protein